MTGFLQIGPSSGTDAITNLAGLSALTLVLTLKEKRSVRPNRPSGARVAEELERAVYRNCLHCLAGLGQNRVLATLPVGRTLAFDPERGRLWVVCGSCGRWNLVPPAERWEAVEQAESSFRARAPDVAHGKVGIVELADGTRLVRVGGVPPGEVAAWRYGTRLLSRRLRFARRPFVRTLRGLLAGTLLSPGVFGRWRIIHAGPDGAPLRRADFEGATFELDESGDRLVIERVCRADGSEAARAAEAELLFDRMLPGVNLEGAPRETIEAALRYLERRAPDRALLAGLADTSTRDVRGILRIRYEGEGGWRGEWAGAGGSGFVRVPRYRMLALEMARQAQFEHHVMEGAAKALELRWREAEAVAQIADSL